MSPRRARSEGSVAYITGAVTWDVVCDLDAHIPRRALSPDHGMRSRRNLFFVLDTTVVVHAYLTRSYLRLDMGCRMLRECPHLASFNEFHSSYG